MSFKVVNEESANEIWVGESDNENRIGKEFSRRITWENGEGQFVSLTSTVFLNGRVLDKQGKTVRDADYEDVNLPFFHGVMDLDNYEDDQLFLEVWEWGEDEWILHTDPEDIGGTEVRSDYESNDSIGYLWPTNLQDAYAKLQAYISNENYFDGYAPENF